MITIDNVTKRFPLAAFMAWLAQMAVANPPCCV